MVELCAHGCMIPYLFAFLADITWNVSQRDLRHLTGIIKSSDSSHSRDMRRQAFFIMLPLLACQ